MPTDEDIRVILPDGAVLNAEWNDKVVGKFAGLENSLEPHKTRILPGGRLEIPNATLKELIIFAYGVQENAITGVAKWM